MNYEQVLDAMFRLVEESKPDWPAMDKAEIAIHACNALYRTGESYVPGEALCQTCDESGWMIEDTRDTAVCVNCGTRYYLIDD